MQPYCATLRRKSKLPVRSALCVEQKMQNIAIFHNVRFTFDTHLSGFFGFLFSLKGNIILIGNSFGADKTALKIAMDHPRGLGGVGAALIVQARASLGPTVK